MRQVEITIYPNLFSTESRFIALETALNRIKNGKSKASIEALRVLQTKPEQDEAKKQLPSICFSGKIPQGERTDTRLEKHSNLAILDFDNLSADLYTAKRKEFVEKPYTVAAFLSPRGNGLKVLIRIKDGTKHREHYKALLHEFQGLDKTNINPSRVCFESYDPDIYINYDALPYTKIAIEETKYYKAQDIEPDQADKFKRLATWMQNRNEYFASGSRNDYIHKLAGACCRFGITQHTTEELIRQEYLSGDSDFKVSEMNAAINSAYKRNAFNSAEFDKTEFIDRKTKEIVIIDTDSDYVADVVYANDVIDDALKLFHKGYESAETTGISEIDKLFKWKRGEITVLTGIGNHGKSTFLNFLMLNKSALDGTRWAAFSPENYPAHEFYHDLVETVIGTACTPYSYNRPTEELYKIVYQWVHEHFYFIYPKQLAPTPEYIKSRFLELIIKNKVSGCVVDPFNQMINDYSSGRDDKYLETFLGDCSRFAMINNVFFTIVCHPHKLKRNDSGGYDAPDVYDLAGGAMWNNKCDNILVYHRPDRHNDPMSPKCEFHSKKIRRQKIVGSLGKAEFDYVPSQRRYVFIDYPLRNFLKAHGLPQIEL